MLDVNGKLTISNDNNVPEEGTMRWSDTRKDFEGYNGEEWKSLTRSNQQSWGHNKGNGMGRLTDVSHASCDDGSENLFFSNAVDISGDLVVVGVPKANRNGLVSVGAVYIYKKKGYNYYQAMAGFSAPDGASGDMFGHAVKIKAKYDFFDILLVVGAPGKDSGKGAAYLYTITLDNVPPTIITLTNPSGMANDSFGYAVTKPFKIGNMPGVAVGAPYTNLNGSLDVGAVFVMGQDDWTTPALLTADDGGDGDKFGFSIDADSRYIIAGAPNKDKDMSHTDSGTAYIFKHTSGTWTQQAAVAVDEPGVIDNFFGYSVGISHCSGGGVCATVDAPNYDIEAADDHGRAFIYKQSAGGNVWVKAAELAVGDEGVTEDQRNKPTPKKFGTSVSIDDNEAIVDAPETDFYTECGSAPIERAGRSYILKNVGNIWTLMAPFSDIISNGPLTDARAGQSVSISNHRCVMGIPGAQVNKVTHQGKMMVTKADAGRSLDATIDD